MTSYLGPKVQRTFLIKELRKLRRGAGRSDGELAAALNWAPTRLANLENWHDASVEDLSALLQLYGVEPVSAAELLALATGANSTGWWVDYAPYIADRAFQAYLEYESSASLINAFECLLVPGLLQTEAYARAVLGESVWGASAEQLDALVALRMERQRRLAERNPNAKQAFLIDEAVLHRHIGSAQVMIGQLRQLMRLAEDPAISIAVLPYTAASAGLGGPCWMLEFEPDVDDVLHLERVPESQTLTGVVPETARYRTILAALSEKVLDDVRSRDLIRHISIE